jgi:hypothetical protein
MSFLLYFFTSLLLFITVAFKESNYKENDFEEVLESLKSDGEGSSLTDQEEYLKQQG